MSAHLFGVTRKRASQREAERRDRICRMLGGYGYTQVCDAGAWKGWYIGPHKGYPFDHTLARRVLAAVESGLSARKAVAAISREEAAR